MSSSLERGEKQIGVTQANLGGGFPCSPSGTLCRSPLMFPCSGGALQPGPTALVGVGPRAGIPSSLGELGCGLPTLPG